MQSLISMLRLKGCFCRTQRISGNVFLCTKNKGRECALVINQ
ncbi:hypothetical protein HMPREF1593_00339 [Escherichia coli 907391]|nr:hypothetical protein HMPREF1593_00339 [Escherichia coli 907391]